MNAQVLLAVMGLLAMTELLISHAPVLLDSMVIPTITFTLIIIG